MNADIDIGAPKPGSSEARAKGGRNRWTFYCTGCRHPLMPGEDCEWCERYNRVFSES